jgi:hypothetical protein
LPSWIKGGANATLFLSTMSKPSHGVLQQSNEGDWLFYPGKSTTNGILLSDLSANFRMLSDTGQLFRDIESLKMYTILGHNLGFVTVFFTMFLPMV